MRNRNTFHRRVMFILVCFSIGCQHYKKSQRNSLTSISPTIMKTSGAEIFQYWELKNEAFLWENYNSGLSQLALYKDSLKERLGKELFNQLVQRVSLQDSLFKYIKTSNGDSINSQLVHAKIAGKIRPLKYLEAQILDYQLGRYPLLSHPTEFHAFIVTNDSTKAIRIYFAASDQPWPPKPIILLDAIKKDLNQNWKLKYHLHNHYEPKVDNYMGILAPSVTDAQYFLFLSEEYGLNSALITNGFHTVEINHHEFPIFKTPMNNEK